jgi:glycosyltransferase involved in cell wall biosynthesis
MQNKTDIFFSVIIPCYNGAKYVKRAVTSVLAQTYADFEIIVIDDGSTDNSLEVLKTVVDPRIKVVAQENKGLSAVRNRGITEARYPYIIFLDHDDELLPDYLETIAGLINKFPNCGMFATAYEVKKTDKTFVPKYAGVPKFPWEGIVPSYFKSALGYGVLLPSSTVVKKEVFEKTGFYKETMKSGADMEFWVRANAVYKTAFTSKVCAIYHRDGDTPTLSNWGQKKNVDMSIPETLKKIIASKAYLPQDEGYIQEFLAKRLMDIAQRYLWAKDFKNARQILKEVKTKMFIFRKIKLIIKCWFK